MNNKSVIAKTDIGCYNGKCLITPQYIVVGFWFIRGVKNEGSKERQY